MKFEEEKKKRQCKDCKEGEVDRDKPIWLHTGYREDKLAYPCNVCGRLHWHNDGLPVSGRSDHKAFLKNGQVINVDQKGNEYVIG